MQFLTSINDKLVELAGPFGPLLVIGTLGLFMILLTLPVLLKKRRDPLEKLRQASAGKGDEAKGLRQASGGIDKLEKYADFLEPQDEEEYGAMRLKLIQAGYRGKHAVRTFHFMQFFLGILFLLLGVAFAIYKSATGEPSTQNTLLSILLPGMVGYLAPKYWVNKRVTTRQEEIVNGFPDSLDMMLVCVEAGQSLDQAIIRVAQELKSGFPALAEEYEMVAHEIKAGKDKTQVLRDMSERAGVPDVASFVTVLIQSASFGTSIAEALRVFPPKCVTNGSCGRKKKPTRCRQR